MTVCTPWRVADSLNKLLTQINTGAPNRGKGSDGSIGDSAHQLEGACGSEHNSCCIKVNGVWIIRARDFTHDPAHGADMGKISEDLRKGRDPRTRYIIFNRRITGPNHNWNWDAYSGDSPHTEHMHVSTWNDQARFDNTAAWPVFQGSTSTGGGSDMATLDEILARVIELEEGYVVPRNAAIYWARAAVEGTATGPGAGPGNKQLGLKLDAIAAQLGIAQADLDDIQAHAGSVTLSPADLASLRSGIVADLSAAGLGTTAAIEEIVDRQLDQFGRGGADAGV
jgi:hypothetical protein